MQSGVSYFKFLKFLRIHLLSSRQRTLQKVYKLFRFNSYNPNKTRNKFLQKEFLAKSIYKDTREPSVTMTMSIHGSLPQQHAEMQVFSPCCDYAHIQVSPPFLPALHPLRSLPRPPCREELPSKALWEHPENKASENVKEGTILGFEFDKNYITEKQMVKEFYKICKSF